MLCVDNRDFGVCPKCDIGKLKFNPKIKEICCISCHFVYPREGLYGGPRVFYYRHYLDCPSCGKLTFESNGQRGSFYCLVCRHSANSHPCYYCNNPVTNINSPHSTTYDIIGEDKKIFHPICWQNNAKISGKLSGFRF